MDKKDLCQFLVIRLADEQYAISLSHAVEIINPRGTQSVSDSVQALPKDFEYESKRIPIIDLWRHLHNREHTSLTDTMIVITEVGGERAALVVDSAEEILRIDRPGTAEIKAIDTGPENDLITGRLNADDRNIPVVNLSGLYKLSGVIV